MKKYEVTRLYNFWSRNKLIKKVEDKLNEFERRNYQIVSVSFTSNYECYITIKK